MQFPSADPGRARSLAVRSQRSNLVSEPLESPAAGQTLRPEAAVPAVQMDLRHQLRERPALLWCLLPQQAAAPLGMGFASVYQLAPFVRARVTQPGAAVTAADDDRAQKLRRAHHSRG